MSQPRHLLLTICLCTTHYYHRHRGVFESERAKGVVLGKDQEPESLGRLRGRVEGLLKTYITSGCTDWRQFAHFCEHHYVRNLVEVCDDFELIVSAGAGRGGVGG